MSLSKCQDELQNKIEAETDFKKEVNKQFLTQQIRDKLDNILYAWIEKNINKIVIDFDFHFLDYMKSLLNKNPNNFREQTENDYLNERIIKKEAQHREVEERAKKYKPYVSKKNKNLK